MIDSQILEYRWQQKSKPKQKKSSRRQHINPTEVDNAVKILQQGGIVGFPTESSYGLAVDIRNEAALRRLYTIKERPTAKPLLILVSSVETIIQGRLATFFPVQYKPLIKQFWPGALTLIFPAHPTLSTVLTAGSETIGIRISSHHIAQTLTEKFTATSTNNGGAITATSANISGQAACRTAQEVKAMFGDRIDYLLDGGAANGAPSTLVGLVDGTLRVLRKGQVILQEYT